MFPLSLSDTSFTCFTSLAHNSIFYLSSIGAKKFMSTFILEIRSLDCHILQQLNKSIMSMSLITLGGLDILEISALM
jgi:hypothetical protein